ncbi:MAG: YhfC family intramembrane metalloprotease [Ruminococcus sp.]|nr:YhfC family intramembrane metalloprotease [Ruminococcus sp.]
MTDINCFLAGMTRLCISPILLFVWCRKTGARLYPAFIAFAVCFPVFIIGGAIRSGFGRDNFMVYYISQGLLYGILEEGTKYLVIRYFLKSDLRPKNAVVYGIGHGMYEELGAGLSCLGLIGTDRAAPDIFLFNLWAAAEGTAFTVSVTVIVFYGIYTDRAKIAVPAAILLHAVSNMSAGIFIESVSVIICTILTAGICFAAYRCYRAVKILDDY